MLQKPTKKANLSLPKKINIELKKIAKESNLDEKLNIMAKQICFVTIKDQKPDFRLNLTDLQIQQRTNWVNLISISCKQ